MGCGGSKEEGGVSGAGSPPKKQGQEGAKDQAASEIQGAAAKYLENKKKDAAAAEIQSSAAAYLAKKKEEPAGEGIFGWFSQKGDGK